MKNQRHNISIDESIWAVALRKARNEARYLSKVIEILLRKWIKGEIDLDGEK